MTESGLYRTTIVIWTDYDPAGVSLETIGWDAEHGDSIATDYRHQWVPDDQVPTQLREFFGIEEVTDENR